MMTIDQLVAKAKADGASDIHLITGLPPKYRLDGELRDMSDDVMTPDDCLMAAQWLAGDRYREMEDIGELDLAGTYGGNRCRVHIFKQQGVPSVALRLLRESIPKLDSLGLPPSALNLTSLHKGIVLVTGETGSGKSTTLAALLDHINHTRRDHIVTLEDPVEYIYTPDLCAINQREVGRDTRSFSDGLRASLREDPNVILIVAIAYYWFVDQPVRTAIEKANLERDALQTELTVVEAKVEEMKGMQAELDSIRSGSHVSVMGSYNNSKAELALLNDVLSDTRQYKVAFSDVTRSGDQIRRNFALDFTVDDYDAMKAVISQLSGGTDRCLIGDVRCTAGTAGNANRVSVSATATFYETMVGGTVDAGLPVDSAAAN